MPHPTPLEFALWLNGAAGLIGDEPPTAEQWAKIREELDETIAGVVASRLLEDAQNIAKQREEAAKRSQLMREALSQAIGAGAVSNKGVSSLGVSDRAISATFLEALRRSHGA